MQATGLEYEVLSINASHWTYKCYRWFLDFYPNGHWESADSVSIFLHHDKDDGKPVAKAQYELSFMDQVDKQASTRTRPIKIFDSANSSWGYPSFINKEVLEKSKHLKHDCFTIRCDIIVADPTTPPCIVVPPSNIQQHLGNLLFAKEGTDVTFEVGGEIFTAHRCVLAARSAVFKAELCGPMKESNTANVIQVKDMDALVFKAMLNFIYTDQMPELETEEDSDDDEEEAEEGNGEAKEKVVWLQRLLVAADRYDLERLKLMCEDLLSEHISLSLVMTILALAEQHHCRGLKAACLQFLQLQSPPSWKELMASDDWEHFATTYPHILSELIAKLVSRV